VDAIMHENCRVHELLLWKDETHHRGKGGFAPSGQHPPYEIVGTDLQVCPLFGQV